MLFFEPNKCELHFVGFENVYLKRDEKKTQRTMDNVCQNDSAQWETRTNKFRFVCNDALCKLPGTTNLQPIRTLIFKNCINKQWKLAGISNQKKNKPKWRFLIQTTEWKKEIKRNGIKVKCCLWTNKHSTWPRLIYLSESQLIDIIPWKEVGTVINAYVLH